MNGPAAAIIGSMFMVFFVIIFSFWILLFGMIILGIVLWILMLVDLAKRKFKNPNDQTTWILVILLTGIPGAIAYYFIIKRKNYH